MSINMKTILFKKINLNDPKTYCYDKKG